MSAVPIPLSLAEHTLYAELAEQSLDAMFDDQFPENGSFVTRSVQSRDGGARLLRLSRLTGRRAAIPTSKAAFRVMSARRTILKSSSEFNGFWRSRPIESRGRISSTRSRRPVCRGRRS